jgi:phenylacetate-CoA ligase
MYSFLQYSKKNSTEETNEYQISSLKNILKFAFKNVPYYTELFNSVGFNCDNFKSFEDIQTIPVLTKDIIRQNFHKLISTEKVPNGYYVATTGGTTGEPLKILLDYNSIFLENAFIYHFRKKLNYEFKDRLATFRGVEFRNALWKLNPMYNEIQLSPFKLSRKTIECYVKKIHEFGVKYLNGYLSSIYFFAKLLEETGLKIRGLKGIFLISENVDIEQRDFIERYFSVESLFFYGHSERCIIGEEKDRNLYEFNPFYGYTELIKTPLNNYRIIGTGFLNKTMPLIRYDTGDLCEVHGDKVKISGRWEVTDFLVGSNDEKVFHSAFNFHSDIFKNITNYQFIQDKKGEAKLFLIVNRFFQISEIGLIKKEIAKKTKDVIMFKIEIVEQLQLTKRGKFKRFISSIDKY